jgi:formylglycine-generating enzyme required for sulfatase activity
MKTKIQNLLLVLALLAGAHQTLGQAIVINSFSQNGVLVCSGLQTGTVATVQWASSLSGPWQTNWAGLTGVAVSNNGTLTVSVPMFYRVLGVAATNPPSGMALIPAGSFTMGDNLDGDTSALPLHTVYVSAFQMDRTDVTYALWQQVYNWAIAHGYSFDSVGSGKATNQPVQTVSWYDCVKWCNARSEMEGRTPAYYTSAAQTTVYRTGQVDVDNSSVKWNAGYRLPTEAEWEKAARGGASGQRFPWGNTISWSQANYYADPLSLDPTSGYAYDVNPTSGYNPTFATGSKPYTSPVNYFAPNAYGLYDMAGNVWQWCWDWIGSYGSASQTDPLGPTSGDYRVIRGGSYEKGAIECRTAVRSFLYPPENYLYGGDIGFRSVRSPGQ